MIVVHVLSLNVCVFSTVNVCVPTAASCSKKSISNRVVVKSLVSYEQLFPSASLELEYTISASQSIALVGILDHGFVAVLITVRISSASFGMIIRLAAKSLPLCFRVFCFTKGR